MYKYVRASLYVVADQRAANVFFFGKTEEKKEERRSIIGAKPSNETDENSPFPYICYWVVYDVDVPL